ncbi:MAG: glycosyltransferase family 4 protein [Tumebacillaceae bacterium]
MNVWVLTNEFEPNIIGGLGIVATRLSRTLAEDGVDVTVLCKHFGATVHDEREQDVRVIRFPRKSRFHSVERQEFDAERVLSWLEQTGVAKPDVLQIHSLQFTEFAIFLQNKWRVPVVYTCHSLVALEKKSKYRAQMANRQERLLRQANHIVVPSAWQNRQLVEIYPSCSGRVRTIENGVDVKQAGSDVSPKRLLYVGRLTALKGIEELLHAVAYLQRFEPDVTLDIVGTGPAAYTARLRSLQNRRQISDRVRWLGFQSWESVQSLYGKYGAVIVPSRQESFGLVALEALAHGVPLVATQSGGLAEFVSPDVAFVIPKVTGKAIARTVYKMWRREARREQHVYKGLRLAKRFAWTEMSARYRELFASISS